MKSLSLFLAVFFITVIPVSALAHSWGTSYTAEDNGYNIDIGYSSPAPAQGESVIFDFEILKDGDRFRDFSDVWVRVESANGTVLATGVHNSEFGGSRLSYVFPGPGDYTISARYEKGTDAIAKAEFPITVTGDSSANTSAGNGGVFSSSNLIGVALGLIIGFVITSLVQGKRR